MRIDHLVAVLLLLQRRGQVTAAEVAREMEVSEPPLAATSKP
jgi:predicted DNA-binding transcriptional regulator YafY